MNKIHAALQRLTIGLCVLLAGAGSVAAYHDGDHGEGPTDKTFKIGKTGEVNIGADVKIGNRLVKRGKYILMHQVGEDRHMIVLAEINKKKAAGELSIIEFGTRFLRTSDVVKNSTILARQLRDYSYEFMKIQIAGENGDHVFTTNTGDNNANASNRN